MTDRENKIVRYYPRQFYDRAMALEKIAYRLRNSDPPLKTAIEYTENDIVLFSSPRGQTDYKLVHVGDLPPVDLAPLRSPPVGRK